MQRIWLGERTHAICWRFSYNNFCDIGSIVVSTFKTHPPIGTKRARFLWLQSPLSPPLDSHGQPLTLEGAATELCCLAALSPNLECHTYKRLRAFSMCFGYGSPRLFRAHPQLTFDNTTTARTNTRELPFLFSIKTVGSRTGFYPNIIPAGRRPSVLPRWSAGYPT